MKLLFYCSQNKHLRLHDKNKNLLNGKIVAECDCDEVNMYEMEYWNDASVFQQIKRIIVDEDEPDRDWWTRITICSNGDYDEILNCKLLKDSCLSFFELGEYVCKNKNKIFYALKLLNLNVFSKPKKLDEYFKDDFLQELSDKDTRIHRAPQSMMIVYDRKGNKYILLSIRPGYLARILSGEKTIEIRKRILKELKELCV